jgi:hypothetical protein
MACSFGPCQRVFAPLKLEDEQTGEKLEFCSLAHLGAWLITKMDASARSLINMLGTSPGRKMAVRILSERFL